MFEQMWSSVSASLRKLGSTPEDVLAYRKADLDPQMTKMCANEVKQQALAEQCTKLEVNNCNRIYLRVYGRMSMVVPAAGEINSG